MKMKIIAASCVLLVVPFFCCAQQRRQSSSQTQQASSSQQDPPSQSTQAGQQSAPASQAPLRVDDDIMAAKMVYAVPPAYPQIARAAHVSGTVVLHLIIATDGRVRQLTYISGPALLRNAAMNAVKQWQFEPTLLNGQPVEVETVVPVHFNYGRPVFTVKSQTREPGSSRAMLTETIDLSAEGRKRDWANFVRALGDATSHAWLEAVPPSVNDKKGKVAVSFTLGRYGVIDGGVPVTFSSGDAAIDAATRLAIRNSTPFQGLPSNLQDELVEVRVTFAYDHPHALASSVGATQ